MRREKQAQPEDWEEGKSEGIGERGRGQGTPAIRTPSFIHILLPFFLDTFSQVPLSFLRLSRRLYRASPMALRSLYSSIGFEWNIKWSLTAASSCMQWVADMLLRKADQTSTCCRLLYHGDVPPWFPLIFRYFLGNDKNSFSLSCKISANFHTFIFRWDVDLLWHLTRWTSKPENWWKFFPTVVAKNVRFSVLIRNYRGL